MNEAHCAVDRERSIHEENRKLKQENAELKAKYEKETLENKINRVGIPKFIKYLLQYYTKNSKKYWKKDENIAF